LGNIALRTGRTLNVNPENGHINNDDEAMKYWSREYEPGWEPRIIITSLKFFYLSDHYGL
jgi:hypothetical protein